MVRGFGEEVIAGCVAQKLAVVARDEREETGERAVLNLGHTVGHAIEAATVFRRYTHGEAVGLGLRATLWLSEKLCGLPGADVERGLGVLDDIGLPLRFRGARPDDVRDLVARDKKAGADGVEFVLLEGFGRPHLRAQVPAGLLEEVVSWLSAD
jgi:3-dehydroquinate synthetase